MSDQDRISPYNITTISSRQVMRIKKNVQINIARTVWQTVRRSTNEILRVGGLNKHGELSFKLYFSKQTLVGNIYGTLRRNLIHFFVSEITLIWFLFSYWYQGLIRSDYCRIFNPLTPRSICNFPYYWPNNSYSVSSEKLILDQLIPRLLFFFILITYLVDIVLVL